jgi:hypothetical protein
MTAPESYWALPRATPAPPARLILWLRGAFAAVVAILTYCARHAGTLFVVAWFPCVIESASRLGLEWLLFSAPPKMPQWLAAEDFDPPTWLTAFVVTPWAAMAWAFVLGTMVERSSKRGMLNILRVPFRWIRFELSPAILVAAAIFSATNLLDAALRFGERSILLPLLLGDTDLSEIGFDLWGLSIVVGHIAVMAVVMAWSYPVAGYVLWTRKFEIRGAWRLLRGNLGRYTAIFFLLTVALAALDRVIAVPKGSLVRLVTHGTAWNFLEATIRYVLDFPLSMLMIVAWAVAVGMMLAAQTPQSPTTRRKPA